ncbi:AAA family ATPase [bacterium]|nr:AAA family ATPase [bacterium]
MENEEILSQTLYQFKKLDIILEHVGQAINQEKVLVKQKDDLIEKITQLRKEIHTLINKPYPYVTDKLLHVHIHCCKGFIQHTSRCITTDITQLPIYDVESWIPQERRTSDTKRKLIKQLIKNRTALEQLKKQSDEVGLTRWKKIFRYLDDKRVFQRVGKSFAILGLLGHISLYMSKKTIEDWTRNKHGLNWIYDFKNWIGEGPDLNTLHELKNEEELRGPGTIINEIRRAIKVDLSPGYIHFPIFTALASPLHGDVIDWAKWFNARLHNIRQKLTGRRLQKDESFMEATISRKRFKDLVGLEDAKEKLMDVVRYVVDPERFDRSGAAIEKGYLLEGPTRTGKTFIAEALAGEINSALEENGEVHRCGFQVIKWWQLMRAGSLKAIIKKAKRHAPCVLFIDEIHLLNLQSSMDSGLLSDFLTEMSGLDQDEKNRIILVAATNKIENLESALLQHGRFGTIIHFENPKYEDRKKYFEQELKKLTVDLDIVDADTLTKKTEGCSYGDLNAIVKQAQFQAKVEGEPLSEHHLVNVIHIKAKKILDNHDPLSTKERKVIAAHQAGRALAHILLKGADVIDMVTIKAIARTPKTKSILFEDLRQEEGASASDDSNPKVARLTIEYGAVFTYRNDENLKLDDEKEVKTQCKIILAGHAAEEVLLGSTGYSYHPSDRQSSIEKMAMLLSKNVSFKLLTKAKKEEIKKQAFETIEKYAEEIKQLLLVNKSELTSLTWALQARKTLTRDEIFEIIEKKEVVGTEAQG